LFERGVLCDVYFCVLCPIVVPLPPGKTPFAAQLNNYNNNNSIIIIGARVYSPSIEISDVGVQLT
jgi:hypothetical protein